MFCLGKSCNGFVGFFQCFGPIGNPFKRQSADFVGFKFVFVATGKRKSALHVVPCNLDPLVVAANIFFCEPCHVKLLFCVVDDAL